MDPDMDAGDADDPCLSLWQKFFESGFLVEWDVSSGVYINATTCHRRNSCDQNESRRPKRGNCLAARSGVSFPLAAIVGQPCTAHDDPHWLLDGLWSFHVGGVCHL